MNKEEIKELMLKAPIAPACEFDPDCANCPDPERRDYYWSLFLRYATDNQLLEIIKENG